MHLFLDEWVGGGGDGGWSGVEMSGGHCCGGWLGVGLVDGIFLSSTQSKAVCVID